MPYRHARIAIVVTAGKAATRCPGPRRGGRPRPSSPRRFPKVAPPQRRSCRTGGPTEGRSSHPAKRGLRPAATPALNVDLVSHGDVLRAGRGLDLDRYRRRPDRVQGHRGAFEIAFGHDEHPPGLEVMHSVRREGRADVRAGRVARLGDGDRRVGAGGDRPQLADVAARRDLDRNLGHVDHLGVAGLQLIGTDRKLPIEAQTPAERGEHREIRVVAGYQNPPGGMDEDPLTGVFGARVDDDVVLSGRERSGDPHGRIVALEKSRCERPGFGRPARRSVRWCRPRSRTARAGPPRTSIRDPKTDQRLEGQPLRPRRGTETSSRPRYRGTSSSSPTVP